MVRNSAQAVGNEGLLWGQERAEFVVPKPRLLCSLPQFLNADAVRASVVAETPLGASVLTFRRSHLLLTLERAATNQTDGR